MSERLIGVAKNIDQLLILLRTKVPVFASVQISAYGPSSDVEVWYDEETDTVTFK